MNVAILDYGVGNLYSIRCAVEKMDVNVSIISNPPRINEVKALILPGVGSFTAVAGKISSQKGRFLKLMEEGTPILGVCLGLQVFFEWSEEGEGEGLGLMSGGVVRLPSSVKVPHMGWNNLHIIQNNVLVQGIDEDSWVYFVHSYYPKPERTDMVIAETTYGDTFPVIISNGNLHGTQFHPEKSGNAGSTILKNFLNLCRR